ncbi:MAG: metallophosphoesterase [Elusimicrobiales bacterium]|nr:metallophosphoesterase [Elusimicrobiales bacterium]
MRTFQAVLLLLLACAPARAARLERGPYLENMTKDMVVVRFRVETATPAWLSFGAVPDCERFMTTVPALKEQKIPLFGLMPDTTHCYRIYLPADESTGVYKAFEGRFNTFRDETRPWFSFLAVSDSAGGFPEQRQVAAQMEKHSPDFVLHLGDMIESGLDEDADEEYFGPYSALQARVPFFQALGNHDYGPSARTEAGRGFLKANYAPFHSVPLTGLPPHYYFFDIGNARFFVLDANAFYGGKFAPGLEPGSKQYKWLDYFLGKASDKTWKFVAVHEPLYSTGAHGTIEPQVKALEPLLLKHKVDMVLQGHDHNYERTMPVKEGVPDEAGGIIYLTLGGGGSTIYIQRRNEDWSEKFLPTYHYAAFEVKERSLILNVYNKDGETLDTLQLQK